MGDRQRIRSEDMATTSTAVTVPPQIQEESVERVAVITLRPTRTQRKVVWTEDTVDNENMNKKKSKCCCIYEKPHRFDESDSEDSDDECEHCFGHVEKKHKKRNSANATTTTTATEIQETVEQTASITLDPGEPAPAPPDKPPRS